jgi:hypothetical protein
MVMVQYDIAGINIQVLQNELISRISGFERFIQTDATEKHAMTLDLQNKLCDWQANIKPMYSFVTELNNFTCEFAAHNDIYLYRMLNTDGDAVIKMEIKWQNDICYANMCVSDKLFIHATYITHMRFSLWVAFGLAALNHKIVSIHSSTILHSGKSILFLGESGTGKSTHTSLWLEHVSGSELLNDDSPFIKVNNHDQISAYGSPWSGKTNCYKNKQAPVAAFVRISQAPYNKISLLNKVSSFGALLPSCPPVFAYDKKLSELIYNILSAVLQQTPVYSRE